MAASVDVTRTRPAQRALSLIAPTISGYPATVIGMSMRDIAQRRGPFVSLYIDATHDTEDANQQDELRWRAVREQLTDAGAPAPMVDVVDDAVRSRPPEGRAGRALIADTESVLVDQWLAEPPPRDIVRVSALPYLLPLIEYQSKEVPHAVAVVDRIGAEMYGVDENGNFVGETVEGTEHPVHKVRHGGYAHRQMQRRVEETTRQNIEDVAKELTRLAGEARAKVIVLAGEVESRSALHEALGSTGARTVEIEEGGRAAGSETEALYRRISESVTEEADRRNDELVQRFRAEQGRDQGLAVAGLTATMSALMEANTETVLVAPAAIGDRTISLGAETIRDPAAPYPPAQPTDEGCRADEALAVAALARGGTVLPVTEDVAVTDGVGALLRHS